MIVIVDGAAAAADPELAEAVSHDGKPVKFHDRVPEPLLKIRSVWAVGAAGALDDAEKSIADWLRWSRGPGAVTATVTGTATVRRVARSVKVTKAWYTPAAWIAL